MMKSLFNRPPAAVLKQLALIRDEAAAVARRRVIANSEIDKAEGDLAARRMRATEDAKAASADLVRAYIDGSKGQHAPGKST